jgi:hypothetical protein
MDYDARNLLHTNRSHVLLKSASSVPAAFQLTGEVLFNKKKSKSTHTSANNKKTHKKTHARVSLLSGGAGISMSLHP